VIPLPGRKSRLGRPGKEMRKGTNLAGSTGRTRAQAQIGRIEYSERLYDVEGRLTRRGGDMLAIGWNDGM